MYQVPVVVAIDRRIIDFQPHDVRIGRGMRKGSERVGGGRTRLVLSGWSLIAPDARTSQNWPERGGTVVQPLKHPVPGSR